MRPFWQQGLPPHGRPEIQKLYLVPFCWAVGMTL